MKSLREVMEVAENLGFEEVVTANDSVKLSYDKKTVTVNTLLGIADAAEKFEYSPFGELLGELYFSVLG